MSKILNHSRLNVVTALEPTSMPEATYDQICQEVALLTDRQKIVFSLLYGLNTRGITLTPTEIAKLVNVSYKRVQDIKAKTMEKVGNRNIRKLVFHISQLSRA